MKKIINGLLYDTSKAEVISAFEKSSSRIYDWWLGVQYQVHQRETLYRTKKGRYFILSSSEALGEHNETIVPITEDEAFQWLIEHDPEKAEKVFPGKHIEEA